MAYTKEQIQQLFQSQFNVSTWTDFIINFFKAQTLIREPEPLDIKPEEGTGYYWGKLSTSDTYEISFFYLKMNSAIDRRKVGLRQLIEKYIKIDSDAGIAVFDDGNHWRLSFITDMRGEKTSPKRFTFVFGDPENHYLTPVTRFWELQQKGISYTNIREAFSVEALTKEFYDQLYHWYLWAVEPSTGVTFPNLVCTSEDDRDDIATKIIRLITRLLFVWFVKQKKLVPTELFDQEALQSILSDFDPQAKKDGTYYNAILQNLFFATLNNEIGKRRFMSEPYMGKSSSFGVKTLFRDSLKKSWFALSHDEVLKLFHPVPFMNCGLFECLDKYAKSDIGLEEDLFLDGFSSRDSTQDKHFKYRAFIPNRLFFAEEHNEIVTVEENKKPKQIEISVMGLLPLLKQYNFTVQENTPSEMEVSLDPELLGQVFENLLAAYNPETKESVRKSTGSFYTPRPIVEYMVNESLVAYLKIKIPSVSDENWRSLISYEDKPFNLTEKQRNATLNALYECKILDPACGSGAFPMGMLQQMVHIISKLDKKQDVYQTKLRIINNCIYGSDIQPIAMLISKLRFFISLICEQDESSINSTDEANNYGINTLPNLETKFVASDSLLLADIHNYADEDWTQDATLIKLKNELLDIRKSHFSVRTQTTKLKKREEDRLKREEIQNYIHKTTTQPDAVKIKMYEARIRHLEAERELYEGENIVEEFVDTQTSLFEDVKPQLVRKDINKIHRDKIDIEIKGLQQSILKEQNKRNPVGFNAAIKQITDWNPYDQLKAAPFFDPDWMFGINDGFDIVIGNPPYKNVDSLSIYKELQVYKNISDGVVNTASLFLYKAIDEWACDRNVISMIIPKSFYYVLSWNKIRGFVLNKTGIIAVNDVGKAFENVGLEQGIVICTQPQPVNNTVLVLSDFILMNNFPQEYFKEKNIILTTVTNEEFTVIKDIEKNAVLLGCIAEMPRGITEKSSEYSLTKEEKMIQVLGGTNIKQYQITSGNRRKPNRYIKQNISCLTSKNYIFEKERIVYQNLMSSLPKVVATFATKNTVTDDTINNLILNKNAQYCYKLILAILNSKLCTFYLKYRLLNCAKLTVHLDKPYIGQIPIPKATIIEQNKVQELVDKIISLKLESPDADISYLKDEIDILVYQLYKLTYEEVRIIDPNIENIISKSEYNSHLARYE